MSTLTHLFTPTGKPPLTPEQRAFLRDLDRFTGPVLLALADIERALDGRDIDAGIAASRRLLVIGLELGDRAREVERC